MNDLSLRLLGPFAATFAGKPITSFRTNKVQAFLIYLANERKPQRRESLMTLLWPGMPERSARHNLRQVLYHSRQLIPEVAGKAPADNGQAGTAVPLILANRSTVQLNPLADVQVDTSRFQDLLRRVQVHEHVDLVTCRQCRQTLEQAVDLYQGDFLADFYLDDSNEFEEWAEAERQRFRRQALDALETLTTLNKGQQAYNEAQALAERQLSIDNLRESAYRQLMEIMALNGRREEALALYENCRQLLAEELGMEPTTRTSAVYEKIRAGDLRFDAPQEQGMRGYELKEAIGEGTYGTIYQAVQPTIDRDVAVKVIQRKYANDPEFIRRFEAEAQTIARLEHPYIVPLYDYWRDPEGAFLVMRLLRGGNLLDSLQGGQWEPEPTVQMIDQIASALAAAHRHGIVHRDIKPANILFDETGNAYLSDFGIAKDTSRLNHLTGAGGILGTPDYVSPEQLRNEPVTPQADIYSLGAVLYETLTGEKPFPDIPLALVIQKQLEEPIPRVSASRPGLPVQIDEVVQKATAKRPSERYPDALALAEAFRQAVRGQTTATMVPTAVPAGVEIANPYKGLRAFQESDAADFYGRESLTQQLISRLEENRFLAVVGPSGSGKSSLVKAGLIPALRQEAIPGADKWFVAEMVPGTHPQEELELALLPIAVDPPPSLLEPLQKDERGLLRTLRRVLPDEEDATLLLVIDQFEELFTLVADDGRRQHFLNSLLEALNAPRSPLRVVVTLRADFYDRPLQIQPIANVFKENTEIILPLTQEELTWAIQEPARQMGVGLEPAVVTKMVTDVADQPGALPLLQYALTELFEERQDNVMTLAAYEALGGVSGALALRAEELYASIERTGQAVVRQLFLRLVTLGEGVEDTRRRVPQSELEAVGVGARVGAPRVGAQRAAPLHAPLPDAAVETGQPAEGLETSEVLGAYGRYRLLTFDRDPTTREPTVEVAHEALLREWPRLRRWLTESRDDVRLQRRLAAAAAEWLQANREEGYLLRGSRLDLFADWADNSDLALTQTEQDFLNASLRAREEREAAEQARQQRELETAQELAETQSRSARRLSRLAFGLAIVLIMAIGAAWLAFDRGQEAQTQADLAAASEAEAQQSADLALTREAEALAAQTDAENAQATAVAASALADEERDAALAAEAEADAERQNAETQRLAAEEQAQIAISRELAAAAVNNLESDPELSILLALEGFRTSHTIEVESALHQAVVASPLRKTFMSDNRKPWLALSPDGRILYISGRGGGTALDAATFEILYNNRVPEGDWINRADFSPDGSYLVLPGESYDDMDDVQPGPVTIVDARTGQELVTFIAHESWMQEAKFSPDGSLFATASADLTVKIWDLNATLETGTGQLLDTFCCLDTWNNGITFSPDGENLAIAKHREVVIWDLVGGDIRYTLDADVNFRTVYSPDGRYLLTAGVFGVIGVWDAATGELLSRTTGHSGGPVSDIEFSQDGTQIVTTGSGGSITMWEFLPEGLKEIRQLPGHAALLFAEDISPDGQFLYTISGVDRMLHVWDISIAGNSELAAIQAHENSSISDFHILNNGYQMVTAGNDGMLRLWDTQTWQEIEAVQAHVGRISEIDVSPDGRIIATASQDDVTPKIWDVGTFQQLVSLEGHEVMEGNVSSSGVFVVHFSPDGERLATGAADRTARIWDTSSGALLSTIIFNEDPLIIEQVTRLLFSPNGKLLVTATASNDGGKLKIWDADNGQLLHTMVNEPIEEGYWGLALSPDGSRFAAGGRSQILEMWQLPDDLGQSIDQEAMLSYQYPTDVGWIRGINFSPDGERIVVVGDSGLVEIRDADTGELLLSLQNPTGVTYARFTQDGKRLMTAGQDGVFRIWVLDLEELTMLAKSRITRELNKAECQQYLHVETCPDQ